METQNRRRIFGLLALLSAVSLRAKTVETTGNIGTGDHLAEEGNSGAVAKVAFEIRTILTAAGIDWIREKHDQLLTALSALFLGAIFSVDKLRQSGVILSNSIFVQGYHFAGDGGGGIYLKDNKDSTTRDNGGTVIVAKDGTRWKLATVGPVSVLHFGAYRNFTSKDANSKLSDEQLQQAIDWSLDDPISNRLLWPAGIYGISRSLKISGKDVSHLIWEGAGALSVLVQVSANEPIFEVSGEGFFHDNRIAQLACDWSIPGQSSETRRSFIYLPSSGVIDFFNNDIERIFVNSACYAIRSEGPAFWGNRIRMHLAEKCFGGFLYVHPARIVGQPNNTVYQSYILGAGMVGPIFDVAAMDLRYEQVEVNELFAGAMIIKDWGGGDHIVASLRVEGFKSRRSGYLFDVRNGRLDLQEFELGGNSCFIDHEITIVCLDNAVASSRICRLKFWPNAQSKGHVYVYENIGYRKGECVVERIDGLNSPLLSFTNITKKNGAEVFKYELRVQRDSRKMFEAHPVYLSGLDAIGQLIDVDPGQTASLHLPEDTDEYLFYGRRFEIIKSQPNGGGRLCVVARGLDAVLDAGINGTIRVEYHAESVRAQSGWILVGREIWPQPDVNEHATGAR